MNKEDAKTVEETKVEQLNFGGLIFESIVDLKKVKRGVEEAIKDSKSKPVEGYDPGYPIVQAHLKAKKVALDSVRNEFKKQKEAKLDNVTLGTNYIKEGKYIEPAGGYLVVSVHMYMPEKKGFFKRLFTGSIGNWFQDVGVVALKNYVSIFAGKDFAKNVTKDTVSNAIGEGENAGKTSYYVALRIPR